MLERGWILEPQGQLIYQRFDGDNHRDAGGIVSFKDTSSLIGRLGARLANTWERDTKKGIRTDTLWGRFNIWHEFLDQPTTVFQTELGPVEFIADTGETWLEINGGYTAQISSSASFYADAAYTWDTNGDGHAIHGRIGLRWNW